MLSMRGINKSYPLGEGSVQVLFDVNFDVRKKEFVSILGPSGSGKSTLMNIIGCLDTATSGSYVLNGQDIGSLKDRQLAKVRNSDIGFVFQQFQLLNRMTALDNVVLPLIYAKVPSKERRARATVLLNKVGLGDKMMNKPKQLSGGQQQRVAIARAMVTDPAIILADEPTGALDQKTGAQIMDLFEQLNKEGKTIIMITHDPKIARRAKRIVHILDGRLYTEEEYNAIYDEDGIKWEDKPTIRERRRRRLENV
ncbi:MAG TPA: ABC transporter ATP-binding protein [Candidatus Stercoripulliclostridium merdigallinarum]|uniref:ABC transporter ATP-binding protein n=1 Tax=Candidatus Stercoripulliclostridium merdigallinarum TaxID=2840951 RepID=A0A9D1MHV6_9FIRM|nr:ABC transporter ATP-binding protein [Candidatus Stercoripulliclostridium merdigallinarum]